MNIISEPNWSRERVTMHTSVNGGEVMVRSAEAPRMARVEKRARETSVVNISVDFVQGAEGC